MKLYNKLSLLQTPSVHGQNSWLRRLKPTRPQILPPDSARSLWPTAVALNRCPHSTTDFGHFFCQKTCRVVGQSFGQLDDIIVCLILSLKIDSVNRNTGHSPPRCVSAPLESPPNVLHHFLGRPERTGPFALKILKLVYDLTCSDVKTGNPPFESKALWLKYIGLKERVEESSWLINLQESFAPLWMILSVSSVTIYRKRLRFQFCTHQLSPAWTHKLWSGPQRLHTSSRRRASWQKLLKLRQQRHGNMGRSSTCVAQVEWKKTETSWGKAATKNHRSCLLMFETPLHKELMSMKLLRCIEETIHKAISPRTKCGLQHLQLMPSASWTPNWQTISVFAKAVSLGYLKTAGLLFFVENSRAKY